MKLAKISKVNTDMNLAHQMCVLRLHNEVTVTCQVFVFVSCAGQVLRDVGVFGAVAAVLQTDGDRVRLRTRVHYRLGYVSSRLRYMLLLFILFIFSQTREFQPRNHILCDCSSRVPSQCSARRTRTLTGT